MHGNLPQGSVTKPRNRYISIKESPLIIKLTVMQTKQMTHESSQVGPPDFVAAEPEELHALHHLGFVLLNQTGSLWTRSCLWGLFAASSLLMHKYGFTWIQG